MSDPIFKDTPPYSPTLVVDDGRVDLHSIGTKLFDILTTSTLVVRNTLIYTLGLETKDGKGIPYNVQTKDKEEVHDTRFVSFGVTGR